MKRPFFLVTPAIILAELILLDLSDTAVSVDDTRLLDKEMTTSQTEVSNSSANATITITMHAVADE